ncbi:hypothetical protein Q5P01_022981 [Channa striata]|uniref:Ig-like domain-containing protein n=1 Tax=Channa striata TaxID=64152 RepID=A0AA88LS18_CHASR|nr:hypothetical protein Q5P01_022981 [Channa striata]
MLSLKYYVHHLLLLSILKGVSCQDLTSVNTEQFRLESSDVILSCKFSKGAADYFFWYRQYPGKPPEILIIHFGTQKATKSNLSAGVSEDKTQMYLTISSAAVSDSAVYYCAVRPTVTGNSTSVSCEDLTPVNKEQFTLEDSDVTLSYKYSRQATGADYFYWYLQYPGKPPEFLISHTGKGTVINPNPRYNITVEEKQITMIIISAAVSDSAVYYCAVRPTVTGNSTKCKGEDKVTQTRADVTAAEGDAVTLDCTFESTYSGPTLFWYKQEMNDFPKYMLRRFSASVENAPEFPIDRFHAAINGTSVHLTIEKLHLSDSAVYYCALQPTVTGNSTSVSCEGPTAVKDEEFSLEGSNVPLSFTYSKLVSTDYFYWYQQHPGKPPQFLISHSGSGTVISPNPRYNVTVEDKQITMIIISAAVSDSAVYYCALQPTVTGNSTKCKGEDRVTQTRADVTAAEGDAVKLDCTFETTYTNPKLFWYKQEMNDFPKYMLRRFSTSVENAPEFPIDRFHAAINGTSVPLRIKKLHLSDSAVYYCAVRPTVTGNSTRSSEDLLKTFKDAVTALEGETVTLSCSYSGSVDNLYWYQQKSSSRPQLLITEYSEEKAGLSFKHDKPTKEFHLNISSAGVSDSAVYYCALQPTVTGNSTTLGSMNSINPKRTEEVVAEGRNINLTCIYEGAINNIQWYRQHQRSRPEFLLYITEGGFIHPSVSCEDLTPVNKEQFTLEDSDVTLSYKYSRQATGADYFYWYRQYPGKPPEFLIIHFGTQKATKSNLSAGVSEDKTQIYLQISSAAVSDSAVYYCAVRPTVTGNSTSLYKNLWSKDNTILHNVH